MRIGPTLLLLFPEGRGNRTTEGHHQIVFLDIPHLNTRKIKECFPVHKVCGCVVADAGESFCLWPVSKI